MSGRPVLPREICEAVDAFADLGAVRGFDAATAVLARFVPEGLAACATVGDVQEDRLAEFAQACEAELRRGGRG